MTVKHHDSMHNIMRVHYAVHDLYAIELLHCKKHMKM